MIVSETNSAVQVLLFILQHHEVCIVNEPNLEGVILFICVCCM